MSFKTKLDQIKYEPNTYLFKDVTHCAIMVQMTTRAPNTELWRSGIKVKDALPGEIEPGTAIATFDANGRYPTTDPPGRHAAVYVSHDASGIVVIDQWAGTNPKTTPGQRTIAYKGVALTQWQNNGDYYYVVEVESVMTPKTRQADMPCGPLFRR